MIHKKKNEQMRKHMAICNFFFLPTIWLQTTEGYIWEEGVELHAYFFP